jgi:hypothetical protein
MAIKHTKTRYVAGQTEVEETSEEYVGRVIDVRTFWAERNMSDTLDYSDWQRAECTEALVWRGKIGKRCPWDKEEVELPFWEQFVWIDCSNHFVWRGEPHREAIIDAPGGRGGDPLMWANYIAWVGWSKGQAEKAKREAAEAAEKAAAEKAKRIEKEKAKAAKQDALKAVAEASLANVPPKGTVVTVKGFTGKVAWTGATKYRGKWQARVGVKNAKGIMEWFDAADFVK